MHAQGLPQADPPFLAGISLRADLGGFCIDVQSEAAPSAASGQLPSASPSAAGHPAVSITSPAAGVPSAFAEPSQQEAEATGTCGAAAVEAGMRRLLAVGSTDVTLLPQPLNDNRTVEFEGACASVVWVCKTLGNSCRWHTFDVIYNQCNILQQTPHWNSGGAF